MGHYLGGYSMFGCGLFDHHMILGIAECHVNPRTQGKLAIPQDYLELFDDAGLLSEARKSLLGFVSQAAKGSDNA